MANKHKKKHKLSTSKLPEELKEELKKATISYLETKKKWRNNQKTV